MPKPVSVSKKVTVRCAFTRMARVAEMRSNPRNPNRHPVTQIELFAKILRHQGIRRPAVVGKESGLIVTGHGLVETLRFLDIAQCPIDEQSFHGSKPSQPGPDEIAHLLADNSLPQLADLDATQVAALEKEISLAGLDLQLTGKMLEEAAHPVTLEEIKIQPPPRTTWVLIGIPTVRYGDIAETMEKIATLPDTILETTCNNGPADGDEDRQQGPARQA